MDDPRHAPLYSIPECARYLGLPVSTVRGWVAKPRSESQADGKPLVTPAGSDPTALSFTNLVELHVLAPLRRKRGVPSGAIRSALDCLEGEWKDLHPLTHREFSTGGCGFFAGHLGKSLNLSTKGQLAIREVMVSYLERVEYDDDGMASRLYPFTRGNGREDPKLIVIDPAVSFGSPVIAGSGVRTGAVAKFFGAGETVAELADEYRLCPAQIEEAVRYELVV